MDILHIFPCYCKFFSLNQLHISTYTTSCSTVLLEKLTIPQLVKNFPAFVGTRRFIIVVTNSLPVIPMLSQLNQVHALSFYFLEIHFNVILASKSLSSDYSLSFRLTHQILYGSVLSFIRTLFTSDRFKM
jgi:hypothetical protein